MSRKMGHIAIALSVFLMLVAGIMRITAQRGPSIQYGSALDSSAEEQALKDALGINGDIIFYDGSGSGSSYTDNSVYKDISDSYKGSGNAYSDSEWISGADAGIDADLVYNGGPAPSTGSEDTSVSEAGSLFQPITESPSTTEGYLQQSTLSNSAAGVAAVANVSRMGLLPEDARLQVTPITGTVGDNYIAQLNTRLWSGDAELMNLTGGDRSFVFSSDNTLVYDIGIYDARGVEYEPATGGQVDFNLQFTDNQLCDQLSIDTPSDLAVVHLPQMDAPAEVVDTTGVVVSETANDAVTFSLDSMSPVYFINTSHEDTSADGSTVNITLAFNFENGVSDSEQLEAMKYTQVLVLKGNESAIGSGELEFDPLGSNKFYKSLSVETGSYTVKVKAVKENGDPFYIPGYSCVYTIGSERNISSYSFTATKGGKQDIQIDILYKKEETKTSVIVTKTLTGRSINKGEFSFAVEQLSGKSIPGWNNSYDLTNPDDKKAANSTIASSTFSLKDIDFSNAEDGEYTFAVYEVTGSLEGITYDTTVYELDITVTGRIPKITTIRKIKGTDVNSYSSDKNDFSNLGNVIKFANSYQTDSTLNITVYKYLNGQRFDSNQFKFKLYAKDIDSRNVLVLNSETGDKEMIKGNGPSKKISFDENGYTGVDPDVFSYYDLGLTGETIDHTNLDPNQYLYYAATTFSLKFETYDIGNRYNYILEEVQPDHSDGIVYDTSYYDITVNVGKAANGDPAPKMVVYKYGMKENKWIYPYEDNNLEYQKNQIFFANTGSGGTFTFSGRKTIKAANGLTIPAANLYEGAYSFVLGAVNERVGDPAFDLIQSQLANGKKRLVISNTDPMKSNNTEKPTSAYYDYHFPAITFPVAGVYSFYIAEKDTNLPSTVYDDTYYAVTVEVYTDSNGVLQSKITSVLKNGEPVGSISQDMFNFTNEYRGDSISVSLSGNKSIATVDDDGNITGYVNSIGTTTAAAGTTSSSSSSSSSTKTTTTTTSAANTFTFVMERDKDTSPLPGVAAATTTSATDSAASGTTAATAAATATVTGDTVTTNRSGAGAYNFSQIKFTQKGTFTYKVYEKAQPSNVMKYDDRVYYVKIKIARDKNTNLTREVTIFDTYDNYVDVNEMNFVNRYSGAAGTAATTASAATTAGTKTASATSAGVSGGTSAAGVSGSGTAAGVSGSGTASAAGTTGEGPSGEATAVNTTASASSSTATASRTSSSSGSSRSSSSSSSSGQRSSSSSSSTSDGTVAGALRSLQKVVPSVLSKRRVISTGDRDLTSDYIMLISVLIMAAGSLTLLITGGTEDVKVKR